MGAPMTLQPFRTPFLLVIAAVKVAILLLSPQQLSTFPQEPTSSALR